MIHEIEDEGKNCPHCDAPRPDLGFEDSEEIDYIPAKVVVKKHRRRKYAACLCRDFAEDESSSQVIIAPKPARSPAAKPRRALTCGCVSLRVHRVRLSSITIPAPGYSLTETAKANDLNPQRYLQQVFETLPLIAEGDTQSLEKLLPWNIAR